MEMVVSGGVAAVAAWMVFVGLEDKTFLSSLDLPLAAYDFVHFEMWYMGAAALMGVISGVIGFIVLIAMGIFRKARKNILGGMSLKRSVCRWPKETSTEWGNAQQLSCCQ